jgi:hypothetical protein
MGKAMTKMTFKQFITEGEQEAKAQALKAAADFLNTDTKHLKPVNNKSIQEKILDVGREIKNKFIKTVSGAFVVRIFKALGKLFVRIEVPNGEHLFYEAAT